MKSYEELLAERDALEARIQTAERVEKLFGGAPDLTFDDCKRLFSAEIAEIKAEAGQAGFVAGYHKMHIEFVGSLASSEGAEFAASQYAAKIRSTGTWLKDSNVNGGKRGGEK